MPRRGLFFGTYLKTFFWNGSTFQAIVKRYHPFIVSFGLVYDFWYHPMEGSAGHLGGYFYIFLIFWQSSIFFHLEHMNRNWTIWVEVLVWLHGVLTAVFQGFGAWLLFNYGFALTFVLTQIWGIPAVKNFVSKDKKRLPLTATAVLVLYIVGAILGFYYQNSLSTIYTSIFIPLVEYLLILPYYLWFVITFGILRFLETNAGVKGSFRWCFSLFMALIVNVAILLSFGLIFQGPITVPE